MRKLTKKMLKLVILFIITALIVLMVPKTNVFAVDNETARYLMDAEAMTDGKIMILFVKGGNSSSGVITDGTLYLGIYDPTNNNYIEEIVGGTAAISKEAALALYNDKAHIVYITAENNLAYIYQTDTGWSTPATFTSLNANGSDLTTDALSCPDISIDSNGKIHVVYIDTDGAGDSDYHKADGMYLTNKSGDFVISVIVNCTGEGDSWGRWYNEIVKPIKIATKNTNNFLAYDLYTYDWVNSGASKDYDFHFVTTEEKTLHTNSGGTIYEVAFDGTHYYTLLSQDGMYFVVDGNEVLTETEKTTTISAADMTLDNSDLYYAAISGTNVLLYQNGTFVDDKVANTSILSDHKKFATVVSNGTQYIIYTGADTYRSLIITKYSNDELTEFMVPNPCTVTFNTNGGTLIDDQIVNLGAKATLPEEPTKASTEENRYEFAGWYKEQELTHAFNFDTDIITGDTTIYVKWNEIHIHLMVKTNSKEPTCIEAGNNEYYTCTRCGKIYKDEAGTVETTIENETLPLDPFAHSWNQGEVTTSATCTSEGVMTYTCLHDSSHTRTETIQKLPHSMVHVDAATETCTECGNDEYYRCTSCGKLFKDEEGNIETTLENETISILPHTIIHVDTVAETCTENGNMEYYKCSSCDKYFEDEQGTIEITDKSSVIIEAIGHNYSEWVTVKDPTEDEEGLEQRTCLNNSTHIETRAIAKLPHTHKLEKIAEVKPTCTKEGTKDYWKCSKCGKMFSDSEGTKQISAPEKIKAKGHTFTTTSSTTKATLKQDGKIVTIKKCSVCGKADSTKTTVIPYPKTIALSKTAFTYNKKVQKPTIKIIGSDGKNIASSNYTVKYSNENSKKVGKYTVTITFKGNYTGTKKLTYKINPKGTNLSKLTKKSAQFDVTWKSQKTQTTGYEIQYSTSKNFKSGNKKVTIKKNKTTKTTVKNLKNKKKYYVRIKTYKIVDGKKYYSGWSKVLNVTTK